MRSVLLAIVLLPAAGALLVPAPVEACSCAPPTARFFNPPNGANDVPLNVQPRILGGADTYQLHGPGGEVTTAVLRVNERDPYTQLLPAADLLPQTRYSVFSVELDADVFSFTTGDARDDTPPVFGDLEGASYHFKREDGFSCGGDRYFQVAFPFPDDDRTPPVEMFFHAWLAKDEAALAEAPLALALAPGREQIVGKQSICYANFDFSSGEDWFLQVSAVDRAGNESVRSAPLALRPSSCGCAGTGGTSWALLTLLAGLWLAARR